MIQHFHQVKMSLCNDSFHKSSLFSKSFKVFHCSVINVRCFIVNRDNFLSISAVQSFVNNFFNFLNFIFWKVNAEGGIWTLAPVTRPIPLAGAPLRPLEYFCTYRIHDNTLSQCFFILLNLLWFVNCYFAFLLYFLLYCFSSIFIYKQGAPIRNSLFVIDYFILALFTFDHDEYL